MSQAQSIPQLTVRAVLLAIILAVVLAAANAYLGLFAGLTVATAIPAAVVSMGVLRLLGGGSILENNIVQTGASAGSSIAAGVIFTIPALIILGSTSGLAFATVSALISHGASDSEQGSVLGLAASTGGVARIIGPITAGFVFDAVAPGAPHRP